MNRVFDTLDVWGQLPHYQLERRADIFFGIFLKDIVEHHFSRAGKGIEISSIIPEFPVKRSIVNNTYMDNRSFKVDYVLFEKSAKRVFFLELKTDMASIDKAQKRILASLNGLYFHEVLLGLKSLFLTGARQKYLHLFKQLEKAGVLKIPVNLDAIIKAGGRSKRLIEEIKVYPLHSKIEVIYILPNKLQPNNQGLDGFAYIITFDEIAEFLLAKPCDPLAERFAESLIKWSTGCKTNAELAEKV